MLFKFIVSETKPKTTAKLRQWEIAEISPGTPVDKNLKGPSNAEFSHIVACVRLLNQQEHTLIIQGQLKIGEVDKFNSSRGITAPSVTCTTRNECQEGGKVHSTHYISSIN